MELLSLLLPLSKPGLEFGDLGCRSAGFRRRRAADHRRLLRGLLAELELTIELTDLGVEFRKLLLLPWRRQRQLVFLAVVEERVQLVILAMRNRIELVRMALSPQPMVIPSQIVPVVSTRFLTRSTRYCSGSLPPSY